MDEKPINTNVNFSSSNSGKVSYGTDNSGDFGTVTAQSGSGNFGYCPSVRTKVQNIQENFAEYKYLIPNVSKDVLHVRAKEGYKNNPSIVKIEIDQQDVQDNEFVNGFNKTHQFDSLYDIDTLNVSYENNILSIRVDKREEEQYKAVDLD